MKNKIRYKICKVNHFTKIKNKIQVYHLIEALKNQNQCLIIILNKDQIKKLLVKVNF